MQASMTERIVKQTDYIVVYGCAKCRFEHHHYWNEDAGAFTCPKGIGSVREEPL